MKPNVFIFLLILESLNVNTALSSYPPLYSNATHCIDGYGTFMAAIPDQPNRFLKIQVVNETFFHSWLFNCTPGTLFNLSTCDCSDLDILHHQPPPVNRQCLLYLPFDTDFADKSSYGYQTVPIEDVRLDTTNKAIGSGSLYVHGGRLVVPGLRYVNLKRRATWCLFFRCDAGNTSEPYACLRPGGLLSNSDPQGKHSIVMSANTNPATNARVDADVSFNPGPGRFSSSLLSYAVNVHAFEGFNQACFIYDGQQTQLYINGVFNRCSHCREANITSDITISSAPYTIGFDPFIGNFNGFIDEVLICPDVLSIDEIYAHVYGDIDYLRSKGRLP